MELEMKPREFFDLVSSMRAAQRDFLKNRSVEDLKESKELEGKVDAEIERVNKILAKEKPKEKPINILTGHPVTLEDLEDNYFKCDQLCDCKNCDFDYGAYDGCLSTKEKLEKLRMALKAMN